MAIESDSTIAILTRIESINDRVSDIQNRLVGEKTLQRLEAVEQKTDVILNDIKEIKNGPVYSLDQFITKRVAQITGGFGGLVFLIILCLEKLGIDITSLI